MRKFIFETYRDPKTRDLVIRYPDGSPAVYMSEYMAASTGGFNAAKREIQQAYELYQRECLACGCYECLANIDWAPNLLP